MLENRHQEKKLFGNFKNAIWLLGKQTLTINCHDFEMAIISIRAILTGKLNCLKKQKYWIIKCNSQSKKKWKLLEDNFPDFFLTMPLMPGALKMWDFVKQKRFQPRILSASSKHIKNCKEQKIESSKKFFGIEEKYIIIVPSRKLKPYWCYSSDDILIDDNPLNIKEWPGIGILYENADQVIREIETLLTTK